MTPWKNPQSSSDADTLLRNAIDDLWKSFVESRTLHPERDTNAWLVDAMRKRERWSKGSDSAYYLWTSLFAVLPQHQAVRAMAMFILYKEWPELEAHMGKRYLELMLPVFEMRETGTFGAKWKAMNAWTATQQPDLAAALERPSDPDLPV
jgi:hypothetical protein